MSKHPKSRPREASLLWERQESSKYIQSLGSGGRRQEGKQARNDRRGRARVSDRVLREGGPPKGMEGIGEEPGHRGSCGCIATPPISTFSNSSASVSSSVKNTDSTTLLSSSVTAEFLSLEVSGTSLYHPETPLLGKHPQKLPVWSQRDVCTPMFRAALPGISRRWKQLTHPSMHKPSVVYPYNEILLSLQEEGNCDTGSNKDEP